MAMLAACSSGPRTPPETDQRSLLDAASARLASSELNSAGTLYVLDHLDPAIVERMKTVAGFGDSLAGDQPISGDLSNEAMDAVRTNLGTGRTLEFVDSLEDVPRAGEEVLGCVPFASGLTAVAFAPVRAMAVHGDVQFVAVELSTGCSTSRLAIRLAWQPGAVFGGRWEVLDVVEGGGVSV